MAEGLVRQQTEDMNKDLSILKPESQCSEWTEGRGLSFKMFVVVSFEVFC